MARPIIVTVQGLLTDRMKGGGAASGGSAPPSASAAGAGASAGASCPHCGQQLNPPPRPRARGNTLLGGSE